MKVNRATITEAAKFMKDLFGANKIGKKQNPKNYIQISDNFTPEEYNHIVGDNVRRIFSAAKFLDTPFRAEVLDSKTRAAILNMGSRSVYVDMFKTGRKEMDAIVTDLIRDPFRV